MKQVWVTRAEPGASATATRLRGLGFDPVIAPLIETRRIATEIDLSDVGALAFTSAAGVAAFASMSPARNLPVFVVGDATAAAARDAGFSAVRSANGDVAALTRLLLADSDSWKGAILHAGAKDPAGELTGDLKGAGVPVRSIAIYETVAAVRPQDVIDRVDSLFAVLIHSPSAGRRLAELLSATTAPKLYACCLSAAVAATLEGLMIGPIVTAALPSEDALLSLLRDYG